MHNYIQDLNPTRPWLKYTFFSRLGFGSYIIPTWIWLRRLCYMQSCQFFFCTITWEFAVSLLLLIMSAEVVRIWGNPSGMFMCRIRLRYNFDCSCDCLYFIDISSIITYVRFYLMFVHGLHTPVSACCYIQLHMSELFFFFFPVWENSEKEKWWNQQLILF